MSLFTPACSARKAFVPETQCYDYTYLRDMTLSSDEAAATKGQKENEDN